MSKASKALKRRGVGVKQEVFSHHKVRYYQRTARTAFAEVDQGVQPGELQILQSGMGMGKTLIGGYAKEKVDSTGVKFDITDEDIGIHRNEGP